MKTAQKIKEKYGSDFFARIGKIGGEACVPKGFAANPELAKRAGSRGGKISKRGPAKKKKEENVQEK